MFGLFPPFDCHEGCCRERLHASLWMCVFIYLCFSLLFKGFFRVILGIEISPVAPCHIHALFSFIPGPHCGLSKSVTGLLVAGGASSKFPHQPLMGLCLFQSQPRPLLPYPLAFPVSRCPSGLGLADPCPVAPL